VLTRAPLVLALLGAGMTGRLAAQAIGVRIGAQAIPALFHADPVPGGGARSEVKLVQPAVMMDLRLGRAAQLLGTLNLEGLTMPGGELTPGVWGEGFVDRRHPHTYVHDLLLVVPDLLGAADGAGRLSVTAGKGFAPFGTDDPMIRPLLRYPVNHHLAQILERAVAIAAYRRGPAALEAGLFNGDEPERPGQWPRIGHRFGDSWSARATIVPVAGLEVQGSAASVSSPEHRPGAGPTQRKYSVSARWERPVAGQQAYGLVEWGRTAEADGVFRFHMWLAEIAWAPAGHRVAYRFERTTRPEEERTVDPFRSQRPHLDNSILGTTRWTVHTVAYRAPPLPVVAGLRVEPLAEMSLGRVRQAQGVVFDPASFYGRPSFRTFTAGVRMAIGHGPHRMGRYGAAAPQDHIH
jgi:hypothetical protein